MKILYSDFTIYVDGEDMCMSFVCNSEPCGSTPEEILKKIVDKSDYPFTTNNWKTLFTNIQVTIDNQRLLFKETGLEDNRYGKPSVLVTVPSLLLTWGLMSAETSKELEDDIKKSKVITERAEKTDESKQNYQFRF